MGSDSFHTLIARSARTGTLNREEVGPENIRRPAPERMNPAAIAAPPAIISTNVLTPPNAAEIGKSFQIITPWPTKIPQHPQTRMRNPTKRRPSGSRFRQKPRAPSQSARRSGSTFLNPPATLRRKKHPKCRFLQDPEQSRHLPSPGPRRHRHPHHSPNPSAE
jgi:hypothetical protein